MEKKMGKKRIGSLLSTILVAMALVVSGFGILLSGSATSASAASAESVTGSVAGAGEEESVHASDVTTGVTITNENGYPKIYNIAYNSTIRQITLTPGTWQLEVWGAAGGAGYGGRGGYGGYTKASFSISANTLVYIYTGSVGYKPSSNSTASGGINGGGQTITRRSCGHYGASGGGATHIATANGALSSMSGNKDAVLVVGGGGGGGGGYNGGYGGHGGGGRTNGAAGSSGSGAGGTISSGGGGSSYSYTGGSGSFGQGGYGGYGSSGTGGGGGGGGYYGGGGGGSSNSCYGYPGGGGSGFVNTSRCTNYTGTSGSNTSNGKAIITRLNTNPKQYNTPAITLYRNQDTTVTVNGTSSTSNSLRCYDVDTTSGDTVVLKNTHIYATAATSYPENTASNGYYYLSYSMGANAASFTVRAQRWWSGTKTFYVYVQDKTKNNTYPGGYTWVSFNATCATGSVSAGEGAPYSGSAKLSTAKYNYGSSNMMVAKNAQTKSQGTTVFNPYASGRQTIWLKDALTSGSSVTINAADLFTTNRSGDEILSFSKTVSYDGNRYVNDTNSSSNASVQSIASATPGKDSSYFSTVTFENNTLLPYYNGSALVQNSERGANTVRIAAKPNLPAGAYYYRITLTVQCLDRKSGIAQSTRTVDVVYRIDNTRPNYKEARTYIDIASDGEGTINIADLCQDEDGNTLTIGDVIVPSNEFILVDQYGAGRKLTEPTNYNYGINSSISTAAGSYNNAVNTAQMDDAPGTRTGFSPAFVYQATATGADSRFASSQAASQGNADNAYAGYYVNTARTQLTIVGNKASRYAYSQGANRTGHFYILVRVIDSGNTSDTGIWFPVAIRIRSVAPIAAGTPSVTGAAGSTVFLSPLSVYDATRNTYIAVGTPNDGKGNIATDHVMDNGNRDVRPFAFDRDNYVYGATNDASNPRQVRTTSVGNMVNISNSVSNARTTYAHREGVFIAKSSANEGLIAPLTLANPYDAPTVANGFKEFFTIETVEMVASTSILLGFTDAEIDALQSTGIIKVIQPGGSTGNAYLSFTGLKITLRKCTMNRFVSFSVDMIDTHGATEANPALGAVRIAVRVDNTPLTAAGARSSKDGNYNPRPVRNDNDQLKASSERVTDSTAGDRVVFSFRGKAGQDIRISPYDLFYDNDTYDVNLFDSQGVLTAYNTVPDGSTEHANLLRGLNKNIPVLAASDAATVPSATTIQHKQLRIPAQYQPSGSVTVANDYYGSLYYHAATETMGEHYRVHLNFRTPSTGYVSFNYTVETTMGDTVVAEIRVYVENSLPSPRDDIEKVIKLSATPSLGNSSKDEGIDSTGNYFEINDRTYNVREFTLRDLFTDPDGDGVLFKEVLNGIRVGTMDANGKFVAIRGEQNVFVRTSIGAGSENRLGYNNCVILEGLSSTQGVPGGIWIELDVTDSAIGTTTSKAYYFQVEVYNAAPVYADMIGDNAMDGDEIGGYTWKSEVENTTVQYEVSAPNSASKTKSVAKILYIASNEDVMEAYKTTVQKNLNYGEMYDGVHPSFSYSPSQVRYLAKDPDRAQGLALAAASYVGQEAGVNAKLPGFSVGSTMDDDSAVLISDMYSIGKNYYTDNKVVQLHFFKREGENLTWTTDFTVAHTTTDWVVVLALPIKPTAEAQVTLRLRDGNGIVTMPADALPAGQNATLGGNTVLKDTQNKYIVAAYEGVRTVADGAFVPNVSIETVKSFTFKLYIRAQGLYDNFSKWKTTDVVKAHDGVTDLHMNNVWTQTAGGKTYYYHDVLDPSLDDTLGNELFRYEPLVINGSGATMVPLSYFAWPGANVANPLRGAEQKSFAWFKIRKFQAQGGIEDNAAAAESDILQAITLTDGYTTWKGAELSNNPYLMIAYVQTASPLNTPYLKNQQRFTVSVTGGEATYTSITPEDPTGAGKYFLEDRVGLTFTKKDLRSVGKLTLTISMAPWEVYTENGVTHYQISQEKDNAGNVIGDLSADIVIPITIENSSLAFKDNKTTETVTMQSSVGNKAKSSATVALTRVPESDRTKYPQGSTFLIGDTSTDFSKNQPEYREEMYFLGTSVSGSLLTDTAHLQHIHDALKAGSQLTDTMRTHVSTTYFGVPMSTGADGVSSVVNLDAIFEKDSGGKVTGLKTAVADGINPGYTDYFDISPSKIDSKYITFQPKHLTQFEFDYTDSTTAQDVIDAAAARHLQVKFKSDLQSTDKVTETSVESVYYPLKLLVYDRLSVGSVNNATTFTDASFDVVTICVVIQNSTPEANESNFDTDATPPTRVLELTKGGRDAEFRFSDLISDADMKLDSDKNFLVEADYKNASVSQLDRDTADYFSTQHREIPNNEKSALVDNVTPTRVEGPDDTWTIENKVGLVHVEYLSLPGIGKNDDAVKVYVNGQKITISVVKRVQGLSTKNVAARIELTFTDSTYAACVVRFDIKIGNRAPSITAQALSVPSITLKTGQYFTLYTTPWDQFYEGVGSSATVGGSTLNGTYFQDMQSGGKDISTNLTGFDTWEYGAQFGTDHDKEIITQDLSAGAAANRGYMAIAEDDAAWMIRLNPDQGRSGVSIDSDAINVRTLNAARFETNTTTKIYGATAVLVEAKAACTNATLTVYLTDGYGGLDDAPQSLIYTMKITVESTKPTAITDTTAALPGHAQLGESLTTAERERLKYETTQTESSVTNYVYKLKMHAGESITMRTYDFVEDIDAGDKQKVYLLPFSGSNLFQITDMDNHSGVLQDETRHLRITHSSHDTNVTTNHTKFTIETLNFHNDVRANASADQYTTVQFYICDPYKSSTSGAVAIQLRVYIYPEKVAAASENAREIEVMSYDDFDANKEPLTVQVVSTAKAGGLVEDADAAERSSLTKYSVRVYTLAYYADLDNRTAKPSSYQPSEFRNLDDKTPYLVANFDARAGTTSTFDTAHSEIVRKYISAIEFSEDGKQMYLTPGQATNGDLAKLIAGQTQREGFQLYVEVEKCVDRDGADAGEFGPHYGNTKPAYGANALLTVRVRNSKPHAIGETYGNFEVRNEPYLTVEGAKDATWDFYVYNYASTRDEALFTDPDEDVLTCDANFYTIADVYTLDADRNRVSHMRKSGVQEAAASAFTFKRDRKSFSVANGVNVELPIVTLTVTGKIVIPDFTDKTVYIDINVSARDSDNTYFAKTTITLGVYNSAPTLKNEYITPLEDTEENKNENAAIAANNQDAIAAKYRNANAQTSYTKDVDGNGHLTITLSQDPSDKLLTGNSGVSVRVPLTDLITDSDYSVDARTNKEKFVFVKASKDSIDLSEISGQPGYTMWVDGARSGVARTKTEQAAIANRRFHISVSDNNNSALIFSVHSYERGASDSVVLVVQDSSGAVTGELTITLVVGNSAPIDKTGTGEVSSTIVIKGGAKGPNEDGSFQPIRFALSDFVTDRNPSDLAEKNESATEPSHYLLISDTAPGEITFDKSSDFDSALTDEEKQAGITVPYALLELEPHDQEFLITPKQYLYGRQSIEFTVTDAGNTGDPTSEVIKIRLEILITKNPAEIEVYDFHVYWLRTMEITAQDLYDNPETDANEGEGMIIADITIDNPSGHIADSSKKDDRWYIKGVRNGQTVNARAQIIVGTRVTDTAERTEIPFKIIVDDNVKPYFRLNDNGVPYDNGITYIARGNFDENGRWELALDDLLEDREGDDMSLVSVKSNRSVIIDVMADTQTNRLIFHFKHSGDTHITLRVKDAVTIYTYEFDIGNNDLPKPNFFVGILSHMQTNPMIYIIIGASVLLLLILLIIIIVAARKKRKMRKEIEALLVSEMELEEQMLKLAAGPSPTFYQQSYGYLPPTQSAVPNPGLMLGSGAQQPAPNPNAIGLNPGSAQGPQGVAKDNRQLPPPSDDDL